MSSTVSAPVSKVRLALRRVEQAFEEPEAAVPAAMNGHKVELDALTTRVRKTCRMLTSLVDSVVDSLEDEPTVIQTRKAG
jgi:hypothetical protein